LLQKFENKTTTFTLDNGLTFVVIERHAAPVVSFATYADVGYVNEPLELAGIAHMFEHMAFKGTTSVGTENIEAELAAIQAQEAIYLKLRRAKLQPDPNQAKIEKLQAEFKTATKRAQKLGESGEFTRVLERAGVTGLNATTGADRTLYFYSLPSNKVELFFALESDRFINPVLREFYTERDVVMEERRMRYESQPTGRLLEAFLTTAFKAHPYGIVGIGYDSTIQNYSRTEAIAFFEEYYGPKNLTIGIAGDVDPEAMKALAKQYFGAWEGGEEPPPVRIVEPEQLGEKRVILRESTQPFVVIGYHRPSLYSEDQAVYSILQDVLTEGRTSRMYQQLVTSGLALQVQVIPSYPGSKFPSLFVIFGIPSGETTAVALEKAIYKVLESIKTEGITQEELKRANTRTRADFIHGLDDNQNLAISFARFEALFGDWREKFRNLQQIQAVTLEDVKRVANETFQRSNRTVGLIKHVEDTHKGGGDV
ncbi:MAG: insulinase family protein, partial [Nitrosospira sp.]|nr:insulinase family protein [Nitrosospira sp.]